MKTLESKITHVTVFKDRAEVTRTATIYLDAGEHTLIFDYLPKSIDEDSMQVKGVGNAALGNVNIREKGFEVDEEEERKLHEQKAKVEEQRDIAQEKVDRITQTKLFAINLIDKFTSADSKLNNLKIEPQKWEVMLDFHQKKVKELDGFLRDAEKELETHQKEYNELNRLHDDVEEAKRKTRQQAEVVLNVAENSEITLRLSYLMGNVTWYPAYDVRLDTHTKVINIAYRAVIKQETGEEWNGVNLKISTAQPGLKGKHPDLNPWRIEKVEEKKDTSQTVAYADYGRMSGTEQERLLREQAMMLEQLQAQEEEMRQNMEMLETTQEEMSKQMEELEARRNGTWREGDIAVSESEVAGGATAVVFELAGQHHIANNNEEHKMTITTVDFPVGLRYSTVPKLSSLVYLKAKAVNTTSFPFLVGKTNVFLDNNFVTNSRMHYVAPKDDFWMFFGVDQGIQVFYKFLRKYEKTLGNLLAKKMHSVTFEYEIEVRNHKKTAEDIIVWDQLPISGDEAIKVHLLQPNPKNKEQPIKYHQTDLEYIQWHKKMPAGGKLVIPFSFAIEYPEGMAVMGLVK